MIITKQERSLMKNAIMESNHYRLKPMKLKNELDFVVNLMTMTVGQRGDFVPIRCREDGDREVGFVLIEWVDSEHGTYDVLIRQIYVLPEYRRKGLASKVVFHLADAFGENIRYGVTIMDRDIGTRMFFKYIVGELHAKWMSTSRCSDGESMQYGFRTPFFM